MEVIALKPDLIELLNNKSNGKSKYFYNIMPLENIPSVIENGILSYYKAKLHKHTSVALQEVQNRREQVSIPNGGKLHSYANLYFCYNNPMMYKIKDDAENLCVLAISPEVLNFDGCIISDQNASKDFVKFYTPENGLKNIDFDIIFSKYWNDADYYQKIHKKAVKCAEILIPDCIPYEYVLRACVFDENAKQKLLDYGFDKEIVISTDVFYR